MERIQVTRVQDVYELFSFLQHLKTSFHREQDGCQNIRIIVLDSLPVLFFSFLGSNLNDGKIHYYFHYKSMSTMFVHFLNILWHLFSGRALMNQLANTMKYIVTEFHVTFLVVNLAVHFLEEENVPTDVNNECLPQEGNFVICETVKPALGKYWLDVPCTRLFIHKIGSNDSRQITIMKSTYLSTRKCCKVTVQPRGVISASETKL